MPVLVDLRPWLCKIRSQGQLGSCSAQAATAILEYLRNRTEGLFGNVNKKFYSPRFVYYFNRTAGYYQPGIISSTCPIHRTHPKDIDFGAHRDEVRSSVLNHGACDEDVWSYNGCSRFPFFPQPTNGRYSHSENLFAFTPDAAARNNANGIRNYLAGIDEIPANAAEWKIEILAENPVYLGIWVSQRFCDWNNAFYSEIDNSPSLGGHGVVIVGYWAGNQPGSNATWEKFLIRNSWGLGWAKDGYVWITKEALEHLRLWDTSLVFRPARALRPTPVPNPPTPPPTPPTPPRSPTPHHPPTPTPTPTPPPGPTPTPHHHGAFLYQWWLFDDKPQLNLANGDRNRWSPSHLARYNIGQKLDGPGQRTDTDYNSKFGLHTDGINQPNKGRQVFTDIETAIADPANRSKWVGLGACRLIEVPHHIRPEEADGFWKWKGKQIR